MREDAGVIPVACTCRFNVRENSFGPTKLNKIRNTYMMHPTVLINAILLCLVNASFMVVGIILNSTVIVSLWRSSQLRKKLCYFTIFVLSCFDLGVVAIIQPLLMLSTISWSMQMYSAQIETTRMYMALLLGTFSMFALLTLNIERFLALTRPFFHQTAVTKGKLALFLAIQIITGVAALLLSWLFYSKGKSYHFMLTAVVLLLYFFVLAFLNYKMLSIVKSKREDELRVVPARLETPENQERQKRRKRNFKNISTCCLAVGCFFCCYFPVIIYSICSNTLKLPINDRRRILFDNWATTFACMNSTFNCVIFFWRNSILRREGMKILKCLLRTERW